MTTLPVAEAVLILMPASPLPEMTLRWLADAPPITLLADETLMPTRLPRAVSPSVPTPIQLPATVLPLEVMLRPYCVKRWRFRPRTVLPSEPA